MLTAPRHHSRLSEELIHIIGRFLSPIHAKSVVRRAAERAGVDPDHIAPEQLSQLLPTLRASFSFFLSDERAGLLATELLQLVDAKAEPRAEWIDLNDEQDLARARTRARQVAAGLGASVFVAQRVATAVSELARNIINYTDGGHVVITTGGSSRVRVEAVDHGGGIADLDEIMAGNYRSKTGMGLGLVGTKRLVDEFSIETGPHGTRVVVEVHL